MAEVTTRDTQLAVDALADALEQDASSGIRTIAQALADAREAGRRQGWERGHASGLLQAEMIITDPDAPDLENPYDRTVPEAKDGK